MAGRGFQPPRTKVEDGTMDHSTPARVQAAVRRLAEVLDPRRVGEIPALMAEFARAFADETVLLRIIASVEGKLVKRCMHPDLAAALATHLKAARKTVPALVALARARNDRELERQQQLFRHHRLDQAWQRLVDRSATLVSDRHVALTALGGRLEPGLRITLDAAARRHRAFAGHLLAGQDRLNALARASLLTLADPPPAASSTLGALRIGDLGAMQADVRLVEAWRPGTRPRFAGHAARAAEHLMRIWLMARFADAQVHDLSICQVADGRELPASVVVALGRLGVDPAALEGPVALPADAAVLHGANGAVALYDAKNTVKSGRHLEIFVRGRKATRAGVTFVATWTDGWISARQTEARDMLERPKVPPPWAAGRDLNKVDMFVLGELDSVSLTAFLRFRDVAAPKVGVSAPSTVSDWAVEAGCMLPGLFFAYPEDAHADGGAHRSEAMRTAGLASRHVRTLAAAILGALTADAEPQDLADPLEREVARWFASRLRLRDPSRRTAPPALGEVYLLTLQIFLDFLRRSQASGIGPVRDRLERLPQLLLALILPTRAASPADFPLGSWDPSRSFRRLVEALNRLIASPGALDRLPQIDTISVSRKGTVMAAGPGGIRITLIARCEGCSEAPLIRGQPIPALPGLTNACDCCGRLLCSSLHGCPGGAGAERETCLRRILEADPERRRPAPPHAGAFMTDEEMRSIGFA